MSEQPAETPQPPAPLAGVRVLDLAVGPLAAIGRLLAELGADVVRVEPRDGAADRRQGRIVAGVSLDHLAANRGKRSARLDLADADDRAAFDDLVADADMLIETTAPGSDAAALLDAAGLSARHPALVILSASDFGRTEGFAGWQATDPVLHALSGELSRSGIAGRPPLLPPGDLAYDCAVAQGAYVLLLAFYARLRGGTGDHLDFSVLDGASLALDPGYGIAGSATAGIPASQLPRGRPTVGAQYPIIPCADGFVRLCVLSPRQWQGMFEWMGRPEAFADPAYSRLDTRFSSPTLVPAIARLFAGRTRAELEAEGQRHGVPAAGLLDLAEAEHSPQMAARGAFRPVEIARGIFAPFPDGALELDGARAGVPQPAVQPRAPFPDPDLAAGAAPLAGLRVLDLGVIVVGAEQSRLLADYGADVVKLENADFPDGSRQTRGNVPLSITFAAGHRNKRGLSLNLRAPAGKALFLKLAAEADIVLSNFKPGTMESLGLGADMLRAINPRLIVAESSAFGASGPWSRRLGYGPLVRASAGLTQRWRYPDDAESFSDAITVYPDHAAGRIGVVGVLALLIRRWRTGAGGTVSVAQAEIMLSHMAPEVAALSLEAAGHAVAGGEPDAPWDAFPCAGDDEWCAVTVRDDADWARLCTAIDRDDLAGDPALADRAGRIAARGRIDAAVSAWTQELAPDAAMARLQAAGVPAGAMRRVSELPGSPYFRARDLLTAVRHPMVAEPLLQETRPVRSRHLPDPPQRPAPMLGEQSAEILRDWLHLPEDDIAALAQAGVIGTERPAVAAVA
ncbi:CaiB/BaiF CoA-transferase family protein [Sphingomonas profundi]|uniref:CaiB/BaiF CoA-transferase family protein n=1 Tax=Alterirhizorhabdus profundi TaxID=2681549 RepID=UPI0012E7DE1F|nr:CoA transferase [Sphingomonas profundi]